MGNMLNQSFVVTIPLKLNGIVVSTSFARNQWRVELKSCLSLRPRVSDTGNF